MRKRSRKTIIQKTKRTKRGKRKRKYKKSNKKKETKEEKKHRFSARFLRRGRRRNSSCKRFSFFLMPYGFFECVLFHFNIFLTIPFFNTRRRRRALSCGAEARPEGLCRGSRDTDCKAAKTHSSK